MNGESTLLSRSRKSSASMLLKASFKFPQKPHANGAWQKKILGKIEYFGR